MTRLRRLLHRFGFHSWSRWRTVDSTPWPQPLVFFQRRHCRVPGCEAEERRVRDTKQD